MESIKIPTFLLLPFWFLLITSIQAIDTPNNSTIDPYAYVHIVRNLDGSITRLKNYYPTLPPNSSSLSVSKDVPLNPRKKTWVRIYLPNGSDSKPQSRPKKLPVIIFVHGGGFVLLSAATPKFDSFCSESARRIGALVVSVEYRLAPEHRLPAAYDDVLEAFYWVKEGKDEWVRKFGDISRCILVGESAGGNVAYNVGLRASSLVHDLRPLFVRGVVLIQPFFGGQKRSGSELRLVDDKVIPLVVDDLFWELSLPVGANRNHRYCNPFVGGGSGALHIFKELDWRVVVVGSEGDPLFDRQFELVKLLKKRGVKVMSDFIVVGSHGIFTGDPSKINVVIKFMERILSS